MISFLMLQVMIVQVSGPPLTPTEAVRVLQASRSISDRTNVYTVTEEDFRVISPTSSSWKPGSGYFPPFEFRPTGVLTVSGLVYRLPRPVRSEHRVPITAQGRTR